MFLIKVYGIKHPFQIFSPTPFPNDKFVVSRHVHGANHVGHFMHQIAPDSDLCLCKQCKINHCTGTVQRVFKWPKHPRGCVCGPVQRFAASECNKLKRGADGIKRSEQHRDGSEGSCSRTVKLSVRRQMYSY